MMKKKTTKVSKIRTIWIRIKKWQRIVKMITKAVKTVQYIVKKMNNQQDSFLQPAINATVILPNNKT